MYFDIIDDLPPEHFILENSGQVFFYYLLTLWLFYLFFVPNIF